MHPKRNGDEINSHQIRNISQAAAFSILECGFITVPTPKTCQWMAAGFGTVIHLHSEIESPIHNRSVVNAMVA